MEWTKAEVCTTPFGAEVATAVLLECGVVGAEILNSRERVRHLLEAADSWDYAENGLLDAPEGDEEVRVVFYVEKNAEGERLLARVKGELARAGDVCGAGAFVVREESAREDEWANEWKKFFKPIREGRIVIVPEWETLAAEAEDVVFRIDPGSAFGTGQHQSTRLCVLVLQESLCGRGAANMLDIGCGSGILSIVGLLLGAERVFACDIDPAGAIAATKKNAALNGIDPARLKVRAGDALSDESLRVEICAEKYEIVVANIVADVIIGLLPFVREVLAPGGEFVASGIIDEREGEVVAAFETSGLKICRVERLEGWCCIVGTN